MLTDLATTVKASGLQVVETKGWQHRAYNGWSIEGPKGGVIHHTATPANSRGDLPTERILKEGRSDLPGPLCQLAIGRSGKVYIIAAGYANHAGPVNNLDYSNKHAIGIECENPGDGSRWPAPQYAALITLAAHLGKHYGIEWRGHKEVAIPLGRKIDPSLNMDKARADIADNIDSRPGKSSQTDSDTSGPHTYRVKSGDTLGHIASRYSTTVPALAILNGISDPDLIHPGDSLYLRWNVKSGQTLSEIARTMHSTVDAIAKANRIRNPDVIKAGAWLRIP